MRFEQTCSACPEQYDVYQDDQRVAYVRLRWGCLTVTCPWVNGKVVYEADIGNGLLGSFEDEEQRKFHLDIAEERIKKLSDNTTQ